MAKVLLGQTMSRHVSIPAFLATLDCPLISVSGSVVTVDGRITLDFSNNQRVYISVDGGSAATISRVADYQNVWINVIYNDNVFYYQEYDSSSRRGCFIYEKIGDKKIYGYAGNGDGWSTYPSFYDLSSIGLTDIDTSVSYAHSKRLNYTDELAYIDFAPEVLFSNGYKTDNEDPNFIACSTVSNNQVITFQGNNYYSIGTNTLVKIDE